MERIRVADMEPSTRFPLYTRGNTGEVFPHVVTALTGTLIGAEVGRAQFEVFSDIGFVRPADRDRALLGTGVFGGYLYGNASLARLMGVRTPGLSPADAERQVFGDVDDLPPYAQRPGDRNLLASARIGVSTLTYLRHPDLADLERARASAISWLASFPPLGTCSDADLLALLHSYPPRLAESMKRLLVAGMYAALPRALLDRLIERAGLPPGTANRLVAGIDDVDSAQLATEQWALSRLVAADPDLTERFDAGLDGITERVVGTSLDGPLAAFLDRWGHRCSNEYELAAPCWAMDPMPVLAAIERLRHVPADRSPEAATARLRADRGTAERELASRLPRPLRRAARHLASVSRAGSIGRERAKDVLVLENQGARRLVAEVARRAAERGGPSDPRSTFCVIVDELPAYLADPTAFAGTVAERSAQEARLNALVPPMWFEGSIPDPSTWQRRCGIDRSASPLTGTLAGIPVSSGRVAGRARVITDPADPRGLEPDEVLVCATTDPSWTPLFLVAGAVVCSTGALQSHAAIVARELGIPAVMSVIRITDVADGTWIDVDGDSGVVVVDSPPVRS
jgi:pyruvate,water dikinase